MKNKKLILSYLIPVKILLGKMPTQSLLQTYDLVSQFSPLINAVKSGNVSLFNETLSKNELFFIHQGIYLLLEKTKLLVYRSLFKRM